MRWIIVTTGAIISFLTAAVIISLVGLGAAIATDPALLASSVLVTLFVLAGIAAGALGRKRGDTPYW